MIYESSSRYYRWESIGNYHEGIYKGHFEISKE
jgi:hypothetical protein